MGIKRIDKINAEQTAGLKDKNYPEFRTGDIVRVSIKIKEGDKFRIQDFEGKVLAIDNGRGNASGNFTVSRDSYGVRVEKLFAHINGHVRFEGLVWSDEAGNPVLCLLYTSDAADQARCLLLWLTR